MGSNSINMDDVSDNKKFDNTTRRTVRGNMLKVIRLKKGWTQEKMASAFGVGVTQYNLVENGKSDMSMKNLDRGLSEVGFGILTISI